MGIDNSRSQTARNKLIQTIEYEGLNKHFDFILIAGDCVNRPNQDDASEYITKLKETAKLNNKDIYITPGNHDIVRSLERRSDRYRALAKLRKWDAEIDDLEKTEYDKAYKHFMNLYDKIRQERYIPFNVYTPEHIEVRIINVDTCLLSNDDNDAGKLKVCFNKLIDISIPDDERLNIVLMHHGVEYLEESDALEFQHWMAENHIDIIFCGHNHSVGVVELLETVDDANKYDPIRQFTCGACHGSRTMTPTMFICEQKDSEKIQVKLYQFNTDQIWDVAIHSRKSFPNGVHEYNLPSRHERFSTYERITDAYNDISRDVQVGQQFCFMGIQGTSLLPSKGASLHNSLNTLTKGNVKILIANPTENYLEERLKTLPKYKKQALLRKHIRDIYKRGVKLEENNIYTRRYHNFPIVFRLYITDEHLFMTFYKDGEHSKDSQVYRFNKGSYFYNGFKAYFDLLWEKSKDIKPMIDAEHNYLQGEFEVTPSLVINVTDECNFDCRYCPEGGENLERVTSLVDISKIEHLIASFKKNIKNFVPKEELRLRITGGEPLLNKDKLEKIIRCTINNCYDKIVLCTNGYNLDQVFLGEDGNIKQVWKDARNILLLKISMDTLDYNSFYRISRKKSAYTNTPEVCKKTLERVRNNILLAKDLGFQIEINTVVSTENVMEIKDIFQFASQNGLVGVKVLTINDFGGRIQIENTSQQMVDLVNELKRMPFREETESHAGDKGIRMQRFVDVRNGCKLTIVDHQYNVTPIRTFCQKCLGCEYYPKSKLNPLSCPTGIMSLTMRADGLVSYCRMKPDDGFSLKDIDNIEDIDNCLVHLLDIYKQCFEYYDEEETGNEK